MLWVILGGGLVHAAAKPLPPLPDALKIPDKFVLLDFYAEWCGTCKNMEPHVKRIAHAAGKRLQVVHLDIDKPFNRKYADLYQVDGTPTYILFNPAGKAVYRMTDYITPVVLNAQVMRAMGKLKSVRLPDNLPNLEKSVKAKPMTLVAFHTDACQPCQAAKSYVTPIEKYYHQKLSVIQLNPELPEVQSFMRTLSLKNDSAYVLLDSQNRELFRMESPIQPAHLRDYLYIFVTND